MSKALFTHQMAVKAARRVVAAAAAPLKVIGGAR